MSEGGYFLVAFVVALGPLWANAWVTRNELPMLLLEGVSTRYTEYETFLIAR